MSVDPRLDDCGACAGIGPDTPRAVANRPGLPAIGYRVGKHGEILQSLLAALTDTGRPALASLRTRDPSDFTIGLLDAFACMADVLTFYQERIANESFVRTATERASVLELARLLGYELRPGVAASVYLAFRLERGTGAPERAPVASGTRVQSVPGPGELPQTFETIEALDDAVGAWNELRARTTMRQELTRDTTVAYLKGVATNVLVGDALLLVSGEVTEVRTARVVTPQPEFNRTRVEWDARKADFIATEVHVFRQRAALFGHNAPDWRAMPDNVHERYTPVIKDIDDLRVVIEPAPPLTEWPGLTILGIADGTVGTLHLDAAYPKIASQSWLALVGDGKTGAWRVSSATEDSRSRFTISSKTTRVTLNDNGLATFNDLVRATIVLAQSELLELSEGPDDSLVEHHVDLEHQLADPLSKGRQVLVVGTARRVGPPTIDEYTVERATVRGVVDDNSGLEVRTRVHFEKDLVARFVRDSVRIYGNVALATHGETVAAEVLGNGDAVREFQQFTLRNGPLTYTSAPVPSGGESTLTVRVDGVAWTDVPALFGRGPEERVYVTRLSDDARTTVRFGDGKSGARLPTGRENVVARLRKGLGTAGNLPAGRLSLLPARPLGVKDVTNPLPAAGGADPESLADARTNVPRSVILLERVVSLRDHEDFARNFSGIDKALASITVRGESLGVLLTIAGNDGAEVAEGSKLRGDLLDALAAAGDRAINVDARSYRLAAFYVYGRLLVDPAYDPDDVRAEVTSALVASFSFARRELGQPVAKSELIAVIQGVPGVVMVDIDQLARTDGAGIAGRPGYLPANLPAPYADATSVAPAELLLLAADGVHFTVLT